MYKLNLRQVSYALSEALDMVGVDDLYHGKRVAFMASKICQVLGFDTKRIDKIINIGMLHDCGVSNTDVHIHLVTELDWDGSQNHCIRGAALVKKVVMYKEYADTILYHHTHWRDLENIDISHESKIDTNVILLADRVDAPRAQKKSYSEIIEILVTQKSEMFNAQLVDAFIEVSKPDSFWLYLENHNIELFFTRVDYRRRRRSI